MISTITQIAFAQPDSLCRRCRPAWPQNFRRVDAREEPKVCRLVWEFFCQVVFWFVAGSLFGAERPFLVPSPAIRFAERAERCQGTEMLAQLSGLPLSVACIFAAP